MIDLFQELQRRRLAHELTDAELLDRFRDQRDGAAFETLLRRHGPMVLGVCRRLLRDEASVEDAFQATFLVLVRQAGRIRKLASVGSWLHGVALRTARQAIALASRRRRHEEGFARLAPVSELPPEPTADLGPWLDEELRRLPERLRRPLVLCYLEGLTKTQAARRLGLPEGTVSSRLTRARSALRNRLLKRGMPAAVVLAALEAKPALAGVPPALSQATLALAHASLAGVGAGGAATALLTSPAATLGGHVMHSLAIAKLKFTALCATFALGAGAAGYAALGGFGHPGQEGGGSSPPKSAAVAAPRLPAAPTRTMAAPTGMAPTGGGMEPRGGASRAGAPAPWLTSADEIRSALRTPTDKFSHGLDPLPIEEHMRYIGNAFNLTILFDEKAFRELGEGEVQKSEVKLGRTPRVSLHTVLKQLTSQMSAPSAYLVKGDHILIVPEDKVRGEALLQDTISFEAKLEQTLEQALKELADEHGVTILLDVRAAEQGKTTIKGKMQNVTLSVAVRLLAEMADLKAVTIGNALFVTDAANAYTLQQEGDGQILPPSPLGFGPGAGGGMGTSRPKKAKAVPPLSPPMPVSTAPKPQP